MPAAIKIALVTGAGTGIGRAVSEALAANGYALALAGRRAGPLHETAAAIAKAGGEAIAVATDVGNPDAVASLFAEVERRFGRLDLLFNNAGMAARGVPMEELSAAEWRAVIDVNLNGAFFCTQQAVRMMKAQAPSGGRIINNGSISAHTPRPHSAPYTASKHAISGLTKATALDGRAFGIACGQIDIGNVETPMRPDAKRGSLQPNGALLVEPGFDVRHIADAVLYMARLPLDANVLSMTVMATGMPYVGRG